MSCEECQRLRDLQTRAHWSCLEHIGNDTSEGQTKKSQTNPERELQDAYDAAAAEYKEHLATSHPLRPPRTRSGIRTVRGTESDVL
jgi:hypothetical protein